MIIIKVVNVGLALYDEHLSTCLLSHNRHHLTPYLERNSIVYHMYTRDWDSSTTDNQTAPRTT